MQVQRRTEVVVLGYRIEHVLPPKELGAAPALADVLPVDGWHEVFSPSTGEVLERFATRAEAERYIIDRELAGARLAVQRNAA